MKKITLCSGSKCCPEAIIDNETIVIRDDDGGETVLVLRIIVLEVDDPPVIAPVPDIEVQSGERKTMDLQVIDEEGRPLVYGSNISLVYFEKEGTMIINGSSDFLGINSVRIFVSDGLNTVYTTFNVTVTGEDDDGSSSRDDRLQYILGGAGLALAFFALLFLGFVLLRRSEVDDEVMSEFEDADDLYAQDMETLESEYGMETDLEEE